MGINYTSIFLAPFTCKQHKTQATLLCTAGKKQWYILINAVLGGNGRIGKATDFTGKSLMDSSKSSFCFSSGFLPEDIEHELLSLVFGEKQLNWQMIE